MKSGSDHRLRNQVFGVLGVAVLVGLSVGQLVHTGLRRNAARGFQILLVGVLASVSLVSLVALVRIGSDIRVMTSDSVAGVESSIDLRRLAVDLRQAYLRDGNSALTTEKLDLAQTKFQALHAEYLAGAFQKEDIENAAAILKTMGDFVASLRMVGKGAEEPGESARRVRIDREFRAAVASIDRGLDYNRGRLFVSTEAAKADVTKTLQATYRIWDVAGWISLLLVVNGLIDWWWRKNQEGRDGLESRNTKIR